MRWVGQWYRHEGGGGGGVIQEVVNQGENGLDDNQFRGKSRFLYSPVCIIGSFCSEVVVDRNQNANGIAAACMFVVLGPDLARVGEVVGGSTSRGCQSR